MTLDAAEVRQITEIAMRTAAEAIRNLGRGTGGANLPISTLRLGTVGGEANSGDEVSVRADGDVNAVPAVNASGHALSAGDRVLIQWSPPLGIYVTNLLSRVSRGEWTPVWAGPSAVSTGVSVAGWYSRSGDIVVANARLDFGVGSAAGTALQINNLPYPVRADATDSIAAVGEGYVYDASSPTNPYPVKWIVGEGTTGGNLYAYSSIADGFGGGVFNQPVDATHPLTWANGDIVTLDITYRTDAE